jgi:hypothetical protein
MKQPFYIIQEFKSILFLFFLLLTRGIRLGRFTSRYFFSLARRKRFCSMVMVGTGGINKHPK